MSESIPCCAHMMLGYRPIEAEEGLIVGSYYACIDCGKSFGLAPSRAPMPDDTGPMKTIRMTFFADGHIEELITEQPPAADSRDTEAAEIAETEKLRRCDDRTHYWPIGDDPPAGTPCKCGARQWRPIVDHLVMVGNDGPPGVLTMERDAARYRAIRDSLDRFVLTTKEGDAFCTYSATTRAEFDDAMQEFEERAEYRAASVPDGL